MKGSKRIIDWINLVLGIWLIVSPWVVGAASATGTVVLVVMGIALVVVSAWALFRLENRAAEWWNFFLGALLFVLPWIFSYTAASGDAWNSWIVGVVVAALALITMPLINSIHQQEHQHQA